MGVSIDVYLRMGQFGDIEVGKVIDQSKLVYPQPKSVESVESVEDVSRVSGESDCSI